LIPSPPFPLSYERYIEVFGGAAWVLFHKQPTPFEVYNDFDGSLVNLFRHVREQPEQLRESLRYTLNSRADFKRMGKLPNWNV
jgi:DNA adenine methylase